ncbi:hypothetical protein B0H13DRAFT_1932556 [Mycena leptocephala]|nr:hypothetical protein B0H13DRAFT_1932556 [Mycena leptocephala]
MQAEFDSCNCGEHGNVRTHLELLKMKHKGLVAVGVALSDIIDEDFGVLWIAGPVRCVAAPPHDLEHVEGLSIGTPTRPSHWSTNWDQRELIYFWRDGKLKIDKLFKETWQVPGTIEPLAYIAGTGSCSPREGGITFGWTLGGEKSHMPDVEIPQDSDYIEHLAVLETPMYVGTEGATENIPVTSLSPLHPGRRWCFRQTVYIQRLALVYVLTNLVPNRILLKPALERGYSVVFPCGRLYLSRLCPYNPTHVADPGPSAVLT